MNAREVPVSSVDKLKERLRSKCKDRLRPPEELWELMNPDGPEAADEITRLNAEVERARADALEEAAKVADGFEAQENGAAWDKRQNGRDDNFNCARASAASHLAKAIRALILKARGKDSNVG